jgi:signal recognition particle subunit SRP54
MGDIVGLVEDFEQVVDEREAEEAEEDAERILRGNFGMDDLLKQLRMIQRLGPLRDVMAKMPGFGKVAEHVDEGELGKVEAMIQSMTKVERRDPECIDRSRASRIARGSGRQQSEVVDLVKRFRQMREVMAAIGGDGGAGLLSRMPGMGRLAGAGGIDPSMLAGLGGPTGRGRPLSATAEARRRLQAKKKRKDANKARKKGRRR